MGSAPTQMLAVSQQGFMIFLGLTPDFSQMMEIIGSMVATAAVAFMKMASRMVMVRQPQRTFRSLPCTEASF